MDLYTSGAGTATGWKSLLFPNVFGTVCSAVVRHRKLKVLAAAGHYNQLALWYCNVDCQTLFDLLKWDGSISELVCHLGMSSGYGGYILAEAGQQC